MTSSNIIINSEADWHAFRLTHLGASDAPCVILGSAYGKTALDLYREKRGEKPREDISGNPAVMRGKKMEPIIRRIFAATHDEYDVEYRGAWDVEVCEDDPRLSATLDGRLAMPDGSLGVLEIKSRAATSESEWMSWVRYAREPHANHLAQLTAQRLACEWATFSVIVYGIEWEGEFLTRSYRYDVPPHPLAQTRETLSRFMDSVEAGTPPEFRITL